MAGDARPVPYPAGTRAKGWRFELDYERIEQSDTWDLAAEVPMAQHALLMMWLVAWKQDPCGSMPSDDAQIRAKCRIPPKQWPAMREILLRGWWLADDGRLYHDVLVERVGEMLEYRRKEAERRNRNRGKKGGVPDVSRGTTAEQHPESHGMPDTGTGTGTLEVPTVVGTARKRVAPPARPDDVAEQVWNDWTALRRAKKAPVTDTVLAEAQREAVKAGLPLERFLAVWCARGSQGLQADWLKPHERGPAANAQSFAERDRDAGMARWEQMTGRIHPDRQPRGAVIDVTPAGQPDLLERS